MNLWLNGTWEPGEQQAWAEALRVACPSHNLLLDRSNETTVDVAIVANPPRGTLQGLPALKLIQSLWAGVDRLVLDPTLPEGVPLARMVDPAMNAAMAETALWAVLSLHRGFFRYAAQQRAGEWTVLPQRRADELHVLVLGFGEMGRTAARRLADQGYRVTAWRRTPAPAEPGIALNHDATPPWGGADIVVNLLPLTEATRGVLDAKGFAALPRGAGIVNLARGAHLVDDDLLAALDGGHLSHAVLDVFHAEPLPVSHRFWQHPQVTLLPHAAAQTDHRSAAQVVAANIEALAQGRPLANLVDRSRGY